MTHPCQYNVICIWGGSVFFVNPKVNTIRAPIRVIIYLTLRMLPDPVYAQLRSLPIKLDPRTLMD